MDSYGKCLSVQHNDNDDNGNHSMRQIEANIANRNYTTHIREWHDDVNDRGRVDYWSSRSGGPVSSIYDFTKKEYVHTNATGCFHGSTDHLQGRNFMASHVNGSIHLSTTEQFFALADGKTHTYVGTTSVRGISCDTWTTDFVCVNRDPTHSCDLNYTLTWTFADSYWSIPESSTQRVPIRIELRGKRTRRRSSVPYTYDILHYYDFVAFHVGEPSNTYFQQPCGEVCVSVNRTWTPLDMPATQCPEICNHNDKASSSDWSSSQVGGLAFGMLVIGIVLTLLCMYINTLVNKKADVSSRILSGDGDADDGSRRVLSSGEL